MEKVFIDKDISLLYVEAESFPTGIMAAFDTLNERIGTKSGRNFFGISYPKMGRIVYLAAAEESYTGEAQKLSCKTFTIKKGTYESIFINNFMEDVSSVGNAFQQLLTHPNIDPDGCCVEMYLGEKAVRCMVRLKNS